MKLKSLHIYGYGKFIDFHIENISTLQVFYGENEAGKSTIMSFIHSILFGFPGRQQAEKRYEPKTHAAYGGQLITYFEQYGEVKIERVKGKATGDVSVLLEDGTAGGEELLSKLLIGMDRLMYESIFSFNLQGLQTIQRLKGDDISRYLVAAGTIGTDVLLNVEQQFQKELDLLFKPGGRKPKLNEQLRDLRAQESDLKTAKQKNAQYISIIDKKERAEKEIDLIESEVKKLQAKLSRYDDLRRKWPLFKEREKLLNRLEELGDLSFPIEGIARYEKYTDKLIVISSRLNALQERIQQTKWQLDKQVPNKAFSESIHQAEKLIGEGAWYKQLYEEIEALERQLQEYDKQAETIGGELFYPREKWDKLEQLDLGIDMKGKIKEAIQNYDRLHLRREDLRSQLHLAISEKQSIEIKCERLEQDMLSEESFQQLQMQKKKTETTDQLISDKQQFEHELVLLKNQKSQYEQEEKERVRKKFISSSIFLLLCLGLFVWSISESQWLVSGFSVIVMIYAITSGLPYVRKKDSTSIFRDMENIQKQIQKITESLAQRDKNGDQVYSNYEKQLHIREEWSKWIIYLEQLEQRLADLDKQESSLNSEINHIYTKLEEIKTRLGIDSNFSVNRLEDAFELLRQLSHILKMKESVMNQLEVKQGKSERWFIQLQKTTEVAGIDELDVNTALFKLKECIKIEQEKRYVQKELVQKISELTNDIMPLENEVIALKSSINKLLTLAQTDNEEEFRSKAKRFIEMNSIKDRLELIHSQLGEDAEYSTKFYLSEQEMKDHQSELKDSINEQSTELEKLRNELASYRHQVQVLEEGGTYTEQLHRFHQLKSLFNEEARKWTKYALAMRVLTATMDKYKEDRFPKVMLKAQEYFSFLTDGEYQRIYIKQEGSLVVERKDHLLFDPAELSQGTGEQLYISLRFALMEVLKLDFPFPMIIDDGFVNFDKQRTDKIIQLISECHGNTQVLLFTCHAHIKDYFQSENVTQLASNVKSQLMTSEGTIVFGSR
ncbi:ATP-binding protein [Bacillus sp. FSL K6-3431]|uniref:ATP-binding protein n=1 Tax=Bacillus sp. FSL K6-3431 TaxID=2921500 RepID=UPI0030FA40DE